MKLIEVLATFPDPACVEIIILCDPSSPQANADPIALYLFPPTPSLSLSPQPGLQTFWTIYHIYHLLFLRELLVAIISKC